MRIDEVDGKVWILKRLYLMSWGIEGKSLIVVV